MNKKKKIFKILVFSLLITSIGSASVIASSNKSVKDKVDKLTANSTENEISDESVISTESPSKQLIEQLKDTSDVE